eukprot:5713353-Pyramimonas_sp.AAC.1
MLSSSLDSQDPHPSTAAARTPPPAVEAGQHCRRKRSVPMWASQLQACSLALLRGSGQWRNADEKARTPETFRNCGQRNCVGPLGPSQAKPLGSSWRLLGPSGGHLGSRRSFGVSRPFRTTSGGPFGSPWGPLGPETNTREDDPKSGGLAANPKRVMISGVGLF